MKKILLIAAIAAITLTAKAQEAAKPEGLNYTTPRLMPKRILLPL